MAITVTSDMTLIDNCDAATWSAGAVDDAYMVEGTGCLGIKVSVATSALNTYTLPTPVDMTGKFLVQPLLVNGAADTKANGGYRIYMADGSGNNGYWYVGGSENTEKWIFFAVDPSTAPTTGTGTIDVTDIAVIGVQFSIISQASGNSSNCFWDISHYGSYMEVTSLLTDNITFQDIANASASNFWGFGQYNAVLGVSDLQGLIKVGSTVSGDVNINSVGELAIWRDNEFLPDTKSGLLIQGNSGTTTNVSITNGALKGQVTSPYLDVTDVNIDDFTLSSNPVTNFLIIGLESTSTVTSTTFDSCGLITPLTATFTDNTVSNSLETTSYALLQEETNNMARTSYTDNYWGFGVNPATDGASYNEDGGVFSGNTADVYNIHATNAVTVNAINGSGISTSATAGGVVTIVQAPVTTLITVKDIDTGLEIEGARVYLIAGAGGPLTEGTIIFNELTDVNGQVSDTQPLATNQPVEGRVRMSTSSFYKTVPIVETIDSANGLTLNVSMIPDD